MHIKPEMFQKITEESVRRPEKVKRLLYLENDAFQELQDYCRREGGSVSEIVNKLIAAYLDYLRTAGKLLK